MDGSPAEGGPGVRGPSAGGAARRLAGVDVARAIAIVGMVAVHFAPRPQTDESVAAWLLGVPFGKASVLFALVAGVGVSLLAARKPETVRARLVYRTVWLLPLGLWLSALDHPVAVILEYYAVWFALAALFVGARTTTLLGVAAPWLVVGSLAVAWVGVEHEDWLRVAGGKAPLGVPMDLLLTGFYPTATWFPVVLAGMALGRLDLAGRREPWWLLGGGAGLAAIAYLGGHAAGAPPSRGTWDVLRSVEGHSEMPLAVVGATAFAIAVLGASLLVARRWPRGTRPLAALGEGALTAYVGQIVLWHLTGDLFDSSSTAEAWWTVLAFTLVAGGGLWAWVALFGRGPLEAAVRWPFRRIVEPILDLAAGRLVVRPEGDVGPATGAVADDVEAPGVSHGRGSGTPGGESDRPPTPGADPP